MKKKEVKKTAPEPAPQEEAPKAGTKYGAGPLKDPLPEESFYHIKNQAWGDYQNRYYPALRVFQETCRISAHTMAGLKPKEAAALIKKITRAKQKYVSEVIVYFEDYLNTYCNAYIRNQLKENHVDPMQIPNIIAQGAKYDSKPKKRPIGPKKVRSG